MIGWQHNRGASGCCASSRHFDVIFMSQRLKASPLKVSRSWQATPSCSVQDLGIYGEVMPNL